MLLCHSMTALPLASKLHSVWQMTFQIGPLLQKRPIETQPLLTLDELVVECPHFATGLTKLAGENTSLWKTSPHGRHDLFECCYHAIAAGPIGGTQLRPKNKLRPQVSDVFHLLA